MLLLLILLLAILVVQVAYHTRLIVSFHGAAVSLATLVLFGFASIGLSSISIARAESQTAAKSVEDNAGEADERSTDERSTDERSTAQQSTDKWSVESKESTKAELKVVVEADETVTQAAVTESEMVTGVGTVEASPTNSEQSDHDVPGLAGPDSQTDVPGADDSMPTWISIGGDTRRYHQGDVEFKVVEAGPYSQLQLCEHELDQSALQATRDYIDETIGMTGAWKAIPMDIRTIRQDLMVPDKSYTRWRNYSIGPMCWKYALLSFDPGFRNHILDRWDQHQKVSRLQQTGLFFGAGFGLLLTAFAYLRLDHATRGFYSGRLQLLAVAAILAIIVGGLFVSRVIFWA